MTPLCRKANEDYPESAVPKPCGQEEKTWPLNSAKWLSDVHSFEACGLTIMQTQE
jgi:hypothetical protein